MPVLRFGTRIANRFDDQIILLRKNRAEIEFETVVRDVTDHGRGRVAQTGGEIERRAILWSDVNRDGRQA